jgi:hypothetical protein
VRHEPILPLAKRYNLSDVALAKTCRKNDIPISPRDSWAKE